mmetsp:Transcript_15998/g.24943  ORF Transcript_15998/g.24943 Transcript_15998/m.24943 type:complete len:90 (-) Transcript_15998:47-316(-)
MVLVFLFLSFSFLCWSLSLDLEFWRCSGLLLCLKCTYAATAHSAIPVKRTGLTSEDDMFVDLLATTMSKYYRSTLGSRRVEGYSSSSNI